MNKEYFITKDKLVVMDEQGNIDVRKRTNNSKEILKQENVLEEKIKGREDLILGSFPEAIKKKQQELAKVKARLQRYMDIERYITIIKNLSNITVVLGGLILFSSQPLSTEILVGFIIGGICLTSLNVVFGIIEPNVIEKQKLYAPKEKDLEEQLLNYQNNLSKIKKETYNLNKEEFYSFEQLVESKENENEELGIIYEISPSSKEEKSEKERLIEQRKLLQTLAILTKKNPDFSLEEIIQNSPELTKENKELCLKLVKKDL